MATIGTEAIRHCSLIDSVVVWSISTSSGFNDERIILFREAWADSSAISCVIGATGMPRYIRAKNELYHNDPRVIQTATGRFESASISPSRISGVIYRLIRRDLSNISEKENEAVFPIPIRSLQASCSGNSATNLSITISRDSSGFITQTA